jgi:seryl-tRNA synthetase
MHPLILLDNHEGIQTLRTGLARRFFDTAILDELMMRRSEWRESTKELYSARERKNALSREFGMLKKHNEPTDDLAKEIAEVTESIANLEEATKLLSFAIETAMSWLPNIADHDLPVGPDEESNEVLDEWNKVAFKDSVAPEFGFTPKHHVDIGTGMGCMSFEHAAAISGSRYVVLTGALAKLERVLGQWMLDEAIAMSYCEAAVPHLVKAPAMFGTGQLPKFEEDLFRSGDHYLIPTAEVPLTNLVADRIIEKPDDRWSMRFCALTPCYRAEAGSAGRDTRGLMRTHQFNKVELVSICPEGVSEFEHSEMLSAAANVLAKLGLHARGIQLSTGDMGFSARRAVDLEVWIPSENRFREIASISNCGDFQARRMNARWKRTGGKGTEFVHTLNGSGVAVGRALLAIMENYQTEQGGIEIPKVLRQLMGGTMIAPDGTIV